VNALDDVLAEFFPSDPGVPALEVEGVSASYGPYRALFDVSFVVPEAGVTALIGSNGAGKSTVARVVSGLLATTQGTIRLGGEVVTGFPAYRIARAGAAHVPEGRGVFANLTVEENLKLAFRQRGDRRGVPEALERAYEAFPVLSARRKQAGGTLSGGEQRILSLAKVLVVPPRLLIADEISLGLAPVMIDAVYDGLRRINSSGTALLIVEQQVDRVLDIAGTAVVLEHGSVAYSGAASGAMGAVEAILAGKGERGVMEASRSSAPSAPVWGETVELQWRFRRKSRRSGALPGEPPLPPPPQAQPPLPPPPQAPPPQAP
jgi:branched-chain amino acid transport system ATP-binding protein